MSGWTKAEPSTGTYWLSITPDKRPSANGRSDFPAVIKCHVDRMSPGFAWVVKGAPITKHVRYDKGGDWLPLDQDWFKGAQWKLVDPDPADPFAEPPLSYSQDNDLP